jgi:FMN phosphatase YigB (HAD superfamily)
MAILAFDIYGTVLDLSSIGIDRSLLKEWRSAQLEMTWRSSLMGLWFDFDEITRISLRYAMNKIGLAADKEEFLRKWYGMAAYEDSKYICVLGEKHSRCFKGIYTAENVKKYKPSVEIYGGFLSWIGSVDAYLVSANPFDIYGAKNAGMRAIYINRHGLPIDPLAPPPDHIVTSIADIINLSI